MPETEITQPTTVTDLEYRRALERGEVVEAVGEPRSFSVEDNDLSGYIGVDPTYQNYADETHKPFMAEEGVEAETEKAAKIAQEANKTGVTTDEPRPAETHSHEQSSHKADRSQDRSLVQRPVAKE